MRKILLGMVVGGMVWATADRPKIKVAAVLLDPLDWRAVTQDHQRRLARLKACGVETKEVGFTEKDKTRALSVVQSRAEALDPLDNYFFLVESHGIEIADGKDTNKGEVQAGYKDGFYFAAIPEERGEAKPIFPGGDLLNVLSKKKSFAPIWVDACMSGSCTAFPKACVGTACSRTQLSPNDNLITDQIIELICSENGDCSLWNQADKDGSGIITGDELNSWLRKRGLTRKSMTEVREVKKADKDRTIVELRSSCKDGDVQVVNEVPPNYTFNGKTLDEVVAKYYRDDERPGRLSAFIGEKFKGLATREALAISFQPVSELAAKNIIEKITADQKRKGRPDPDLTLKVTDHIVFIACIHEMVDGAKRDGSAHPQLDRFVLRSKRCGKDGNFKPNKSGLQWREEMDPKDEPKTHPF